MEGANRMTVYEKIQSLPVDEMCKLFMFLGHDFPPYCDMKAAIEIECDQMCHKCAKRWLESEVDEHWMG